jgi:hypothetical protein
MPSARKGCVSSFATLAPDLDSIEGWQLLAMAMIELAIADWRAGIGKPDWSPRGRRSEEAGDWLFNPARAAHLTFQQACDLLKAEPSRLRAGIRSKYEGTEADDS